MRQGERLADLGAVTARIVHDLGNPLAGLAMQIDLLRRKAAGDPAQPLGNAGQMLEQLAADVGRLNDLVREFLDFAREQRLAKRVLPVRGLLDELLRAWRPLAGAQDITLTCAVEDGTPDVAVDLDKMRRVFDNLVKNAIEAIENGSGSIRVRAGGDGPDRVRIDVEDSGSGLPAGIDPFRLFHTSKRNGTGLGLPIVREIVEAHGGTVALESGAERGARLRVVLPAAPRGI